MARNTSTLPAANIFKPASTTIEACAIFSEQLSAYDTFLRSLGQPTLSEQLRENDLAQVRTLISAVTGNLQAWMTLNPNG